MPKAKIALSFIALIAIMTIFFIPAKTVSANGINCTAITTLPKVISASGNYCLTGNLTASGGGININADNVVIDFNGFTMFGSQSSINTFFGIYANNNTNITIRNGEIVGFFYAIRIADSSYGLSEPYTTGWHTIENMQISRSTFRGISLQGVNNVVRDNVVSHIQGNTLYANSFSAAIEVTGQGVLIQDNFIYEARGLGTGEGLGISISSAGSGGTVTNNVIVNISVEESFETDWSGLSRKTIAIWVGGNSSVVVSDNQIQNFMFGIALSSPVRHSLIIRNLITDTYSPLAVNEDNHMVIDNVCDRPCFEVYDPLVTP